MTHDEIDLKRNEAADVVLEGYDFGYQVVDGSGWERTIPGDEWTKTLFFENEEDPSGPTVPGNLVVRFETGSAAVEEAYAIVNGEIVGNPGSPAP